LKPCSFDPLGDLRHLVLDDLHEVVAVSGRKTMTSSRRLMNSGRKNRSISFIRMLLIFS
jgi:hypothetical protein